MEFFLMLLALTSGLLSLILLALRLVEAAILSSVLALVLLLSALLVMQQRERQEQEQFLRKLGYEELAFTSGDGKLFNNQPGE